MAKSTKKKRRGAGYRQPTSRIQIQIDRLGYPKQFEQDDIIFGIDQTARYVFKVEQGCVRTFSYNGESHRLIVGFYYPGDYFGLELGHAHNVSATAVISSTILFIERRTLIARAASNSRLAKEMLTITNLELQRVRQHALLLCMPIASDRVAQFLLDMKRRTRGKVVDLPMARQDIADYLNLTVESVARALTKLKRKCAISMQTTRRIAVHMRGRKPVVSVPPEKLIQADSRDEAESAHNSI